MQDHRRNEFTEASKTVQKQFSETEQRIAETTRQVQGEWAKTLEEMHRTVLSCASAEVQRGVELSHKLSAARSPTDFVSAYQEWLEGGDERALRRRPSVHGQLSKVYD